MVGVSLISRASVGALSVNLPWLSILFNGAASLPSFCFLQVGYELAGDRISAGRAIPHFGPSRGRTLARLRQSQAGGPRGGEGSGSGSSIGSGGDGGGGNPDRSGFLFAGLEFELAPCILVDHVSSVDLRRLIRAGGGDLVGAGGCLSLDLPAPSGFTPKLHIIVVADAVVGNAAAGAENGRLQETPPIAHGRHAGFQRVALSWVIDSIASCRKREFSGYMVPSA